MPRPCGRPSNSTTLTIRVERIRGFNACISDALCRSALTWTDTRSMETIAQKMIAGHCGKPVNPSIVAIDIAALVLGHAAGSLHDAHQALYASLVVAGEITEPPVSSAR
jgi:hypothetical protein